MRILLLSVFLVVGCNQNDELTQALQEHLSREQAAQARAENLLKKSSEALGNGQFEIALEVLGRIDNAGLYDRVDQLRGKILSAWYLRDRGAREGLNAALDAELLVAGDAEDTLSSLRKAAATVRHLSAETKGDARQTFETLSQLSQEELLGQKAAILFEFAKLLVAENMLERAESLFRQVIAEDDSYWEARLQLSQLLSRAGAHKEATDQIELALAQNKDGVTLFVHGTVLLKAGEHARAVAALSEALRYANAPILVYGELGFAQVMMKDYMAAQKAFDMAYQKTGKLDYLLQRGLALLANKSWVASGQLFNRLVEVAPKMGAAHVGLLKAALGSGDRVAAQKAVNRYQKLRKSHTELEAVYPQIVDLVNVSQGKKPSKVAPPKEDDSEVEAPVVPPSQ